MSDLEALEPCPFCGPKADETGEFPQLFKHESDCLIEWSIRCGCCGIDMGDEDRDTLIAAWNTRVRPNGEGVTEAALRAEIARQSGGAWPVGDLVDMEIDFVALARAAMGTPLPEPR